MSGMNPRAKLAPPSLALPSPTQKRGTFYFAKKRNFLFCVDMLRSYMLRSYMLRSYMVLHASFLMLSCLASACFASARAFSVVTCGPGCESR
jgi:hypothetical protein